MTINIELIYLTSLPRIRYNQTKSLFNYLLQITYIVGFHFKHPFYPQNDWILLFCLFSLISDLIPYLKILHFIIILKDKNNHRT